MQETNRFVPLYITLAIDPAVTDQSYSNATGITVVGADEFNNWYILEAEPFKGQPDAVVDRVAYYAMRYHPKMGSCEAIAAQRLYLPLFAAKFEQLGITLPIREYKYSTRLSKQVRIEALQPKFKRHEVYLREGLDALYNQLIHFPETEEDDLLDSLTQHLVISRPLDKKEILKDPDDDEDYLEDETDSPKRRNDGTWVGRGATRYIRR